MDGPIQSRQLLRPWLTEQINSGLYPGLEWICKEKFVFKIPWKHFGRPGFDEYKDGMLFRNYAIHTNKFKEGDEADISAMKTRFRCAMHKHREVEEIHSLSQTTGDEPYKVYRFKDRDESQNSCVSNDFVASGPAVHVPSTESLGTSFVEYTETAADIIDELFEDDSKPFDSYQDVSARHDMDTMHSLWTTDGLKSVDVPADDEVKPWFRIDSAPLLIKLFFGEDEVLEQIVANPWGVRIAFEPPPPMPDDVLREDTSQVVTDIFGPLNADQLYFPLASDPSVMAILECMKRGLVLQVINGEIWATRLCRAKIFFADTVSSEADVQELKRQLTTKVFDYSNEFVPALQQYVLGQRAAPASDLYFSFGQRWSSLALLKSNFVYVSVTHMLAQQNLKEVHKQRLNSILVSDPNCLDEIYSQIEDLNLNGELHVSMQSRSFDQSYD